MAINSTTNLGLALPDQGEWDGTWGTNLNNQITTLIDSAVAGTTTLSADSDVTLTDTDFAANQSRQAIILWTASNGATTRNITAPARSKTYVVVNSGTGSIVLRGDTSPTPTTGITIVAGERCVAAWSGSDFVKVATSVADGVTSVGGTGTVNGITLSGTVTSTGNLTLGGALTGVNLATQVTGTLPVANGGTGQTTANAAFNALAPSQTGNAGRVLTTNGTNTSWTASLTAAGSNTQVQFNSSGVFGASSNLTFDGASLSVDGIVITRGANSIDTNISVGSSLGAITTGFNNTAVGNSSFNQNTSGNANTAVGSNAMFSNTTGNINVALGASALRSNTTGSQNTAVGTSSLFNNTTASDNVAVGPSSLFNNTTGSGNTGVGSGALFNNTTASNNVAVGAAALGSSTSASNTAVGFSALTNLTTGANNIAIGELAGNDITTGGNNTIIGGFVGSTTLTGVVAINAAGTNRIYVDSSGNVGFGTTSPTGNIDHTGSTLRLRTSRTPASASATGNAGEICWDSNYVYVCVATNTWKRAALSTW